MEKPAAECLSVEQRCGGATIPLEGELSLAVAARLSAALTALLEARRDTVIGLAAVTGADFAGLQLLCSAHRSFLRQGLSLRLESGPESLRRSALAGGFDAERSVCPYRTDECLWQAWEGQCHEPSWP